MKYKGRPQSRNIDDRRSPFGSNSLNTSMSWNDKVKTFLGESLSSSTSGKRTEYNTLKKAK